MSQTLENLSPEQLKELALVTAKLGALNIRGSLLRVQSGPIVTTYFFQLDHDIPISKIMKAEEDLALASGAPSVLITRERGAIAIAIPKATPEIVSFDKALAHLVRKSTGIEAARLPLMLGVDPTGRETILDLVEGPHVLLAGSTGSGKSVLLAAMICGLAIARTKAEMKMVLIDTKQLDLTLFENLPHVVNVADNLLMAHTAIQRLIEIVRQRTQLMKGLARNIREYNALVPDEKKLSYYVVVIDELADVIGQDRSIVKGQRGYEKFEEKLQSLLQICRAAGVHVICATQRPSVDIITGDIKANIPTRIALKLPSSADSRTVLNSGGAEHLLGRGDMLVESAMFQQGLARLHGPYVSINHIAAILADCDMIRTQLRKDVEYA